MKRRRTGLPTNKHREEAIAYFREHTELTAEECAAKFGVSTGTLYRWNQESYKSSRVNENTNSDNGLVNNESDDENKVERLKRELKEAQGEIEVLKKAISILGKSN